MIEPIKTEENRNPDGTFAKGNPGGPGRPPKKSFRDYFSEQEEQDLIVAVKAVMKERPEILKMTIEHIFGKPKQNMSIDGGEDEKGNLKPVLVKFIDAKPESDPNTTGVPTAIQ